MLVVFKYANELGLEPGLNSPERAVYRSQQFLRMFTISDFPSKYYLLTNWLAYLYGRIQSPRPDVMPDRREGITRAAGFVFACIDTQTS